MHITTKDFVALTAGDLMSPDVLVIPHAMTMPDAARLLWRAQVSGAPVVDEHGRCVGILSATDFVTRAGTDPPATPVRPVTCGFQEKTWDAAGREAVACKLPPGTCPIQRPGTGPHGLPLSICCEPHSVPSDWQIVNEERLPTDRARQYMTTDLVSATRETPIDEVARRMIDSHVHRLMVVDDAFRPVGIVSSTDVLAAVAEAG